MRNYKRKYTEEQLSMSHFHDTKYDTNVLTNRLAILLQEACDTRCKYYDEIWGDGVDEKTGDALARKYCDTCPLEKIM